MFKPELRSTRLSSPPGTSAMARREVLCKGAACTRPTSSARLLCPRCLDIAAERYVALSTFSRDAKAANDENPAANVAKSSHEADANPAANVAKCSAASDIEEGWTGVEDEDAELDVIITALDDEDRRIQRVLKVMLKFVVAVFKVLKQPQP